MEATREIYWNIGHGVVLPMYQLALAAFGIMAWGFWQRLPIWRQGKALDRFDRFDERVKRMVAEVFSQSRISRVKEGGIFHSLFFWGFLTLFAGTMLVMLQADFFTPLMKVNLLSGEFYKGFSLVLDLAGLLALLMLAGLFIRRFVIQPKGLEIVKDDYIVLQLLLAILITGFLVEGARMAATELRQNPALAIYSPIGLLAGQLFGAMTQGTLLATHKILWWLHFVLVLGFFCAVPYTKLKHILTTSVNAFLAPLEPKGALATINLEEEGVEQFGAAAIGDLSRKDRRCLHLLQALPGPLPGRHNRQTALTDEGRPADRRSGREQSGRQPDRNCQPGSALGLYHLPGLPGHLSSQHRARQQNHRDET